MQSKAQEWMVIVTQFMLMVVVLLGPLCIFFNMVNRVNCTNTTAESTLLRNSLDTTVQGQILSSIVFFPVKKDYLMYREVLAGFVLACFFMENYIVLCDVCCVLHIFLYCKLKKHSKFYLKYSLVLNFKIFVCITLTDFFQRLHQCHNQLLFTVCVLSCFKLFIVTIVGAAT